MSIGPLTYEPFFGLRKKPFSLASDPEFLYESPSHAAALEALLAGIKRREGLLALTGDVGTGKTTICRAVLRNLDRKTFSTFVPDPFVSREDLLKMLLIDFGVASVQDFTSGPLERATRTELSYLLSSFLDTLVPLDAFVVVFIDEAQNMSLSLIEEVRILSDGFSHHGQLQVVFVGQLELLEKLKSPMMRQVDQRVCVYSSLDPLGFEDVLRYVQHRLQIAGATPNRITFAPSALGLLHEQSRGIPRLINRICDRALHGAYLRHSTVIDHGTMAAAVTDVLRPSATIAPDAPAQPTIAVERPAVADRGTPDDHIELLEVSEESPDLAVPIPESEVAAETVAAAEWVLPVEMETVVDLEWEAEALAEAEPHAEPTPEPVAESVLGDSDTLAADIETLAADTETISTETALWEQTAPAEHIDSDELAADGEALTLPDDTPEASSSDREYEAAFKAKVDAWLAEIASTKTDDLAAALQDDPPPPVEVLSTNADGQADWSTRSRPEEPRQRATIGRPWARRAMIATAIFATLNVLVAAAAYMPGGLNVLLAPGALPPVAAPPRIDVPPVVHPAAPSFAIGDATAAEHYVIAVGLYISAERADRLVSILAQERFQAFARPMPVRDRVLEQVLVGPFDSRRAADAELARLRGIGDYTDAQIMPFRRPGA
jgi:type II secretory pathway predicted ATPase ExeA/cell division septation protein DedD